MDPKELTGSEISDLIMQGENLRGPIVQKLRGLLRTAESEETASLRAEVERLTKERDSLRALLKSAEVVVQAFATDNPRWRDVRGEWQDPCGATALLTEIASALGAAR